MAFILPFESEIARLQRELKPLPADDPRRAELLTKIEHCERDTYPHLGPYDLFLLSGHPSRPKALDYVNHIFHDVQLIENPDIPGDHMLIGGQARIDLAGQSHEIIFIGQQTGPSSRSEDLRTLTVEEYRRWNQGMGYPDGYRKAVYLMELAERTARPVVVFVDTPGADPSEHSEEEGQAFAINEVIHRTTALRVPNLSYIISLGASGGAIALTPTNRVLMNEYATYMVISPGGCASILFRNRSPESIRRAAEGLRLTSADALQQGTVDEVIPEGARPGHRYPQELLERGADAVRRHLADLMNLDGDAALRARREKYFAMGAWGTADRAHKPDALARRAAEQKRSEDVLRTALAGFAQRENDAIVALNGRRRDPESVEALREARYRMARLIHAVKLADSLYLSQALEHEEVELTQAQWQWLADFIMARRYGHPDGAESLAQLHPTERYFRLPPVDWIRLLTDDGTFREFKETIRYCSVDQLQFPLYREALEKGVARTGLHSGLITGDCRIAGQPAVLAVNNFGLVGSSLCDEIGEKFRFAAGVALRNRVPFVSLSMGGGARMQEGTPSMHRNIPKVHHALNELEDAAVPHISIIADPTLGGTAISYGLRGDYMIVVQGSANIGFSGRRVVEQFQGRPVHEGFQNGEWLLHRGFVDEVVHTHALYARLSELLQVAAAGGRLADLQTRRPRHWRPAHSHEHEVMLSEAKHL